MLRLAQSFVQKGVNVDLLLASRGGALFDQIPPGVRVVALNASGVLSAFPGLVRYLRRQRPFALLSTLDHANIVAIAAKYLSFAGTRVIVRIATPISVAMPRSEHRLDHYIPLGARLCYPHADAIITVSQGVAADLTKVTKRVVDKTHIIYNPVPVEAIWLQAQEPVDHAWFRPGEPPVIIAVGRLTTLKDFPTLIRAFRRVLSQRPVRLMIFGEGEARPNLEMMILEMKLKEQIALPGFANNVFTYMKRAAMLVLSSKWEGFPNVVLEALACGCPVVSTNCPGGAAELLGNGLYGKLVPVGDDEAMASAISATLDTPPDPVTLQHYVSRKFAHDTIADQYLQVMRRGTRNA